MLDYLLPGHLAEGVEVGTIVRVPLQGRRVRGWVVAVDRDPPPGVALRPVAKITGRGPDETLVELAGWAAWRWAGRRTQFLRAASPDRSVPLARRARADGSGPGGRQERPDRAEPPAAAHAARRRFVEELAGDAFAGQGALVRLPPAADPFPLVAEAARRGQALVLAPAVGAADDIARRLTAAGHRVARHPDGWAAAAGGATVVGGRAAAWAPAPALAAVVALDEHDERYRAERAPTWNAVDVVAERARRAGVPLVTTSPVPTLDALRSGRRLLRAARADERAGWPAVLVVDRRREDPRSGLWSAPLVRLVRGPARVLVVLNRTGRARLLACTRCGDLARCETCGGALTSAGTGELCCPRGHGSRPEVCPACGTTRLAVVRPGVGRVRDELEALAGEPVVELTAAGEVSAGLDGAGPARLVVGTSAALHRLDSVDVVAFVDFDQELLAHRYRAAEQAADLLVLAARLVGGRDDGGRLLIQTRMPHHDVVEAAVRADPSRIAAAADPQRQLLGLPPYGALALVSGPGAAEFAAAVPAEGGVTVLADGRGGHLVRASEWSVLADALARVPRPAERTRVEVDPRHI